jgi:ATP:corrinoid adenosyltransferase
MSPVVPPNHLHAADELQVAIYRAMTPQRRLEQALRMNHRMRELMATGIRDRHPGWTEAQVKGAVADRILHARTG